MTTLLIAVLLTYALGFVAIFRAATRSMSAAKAAAVAAIWPAAAAALLWDRR